MKTKFILAAVVLRAIAHAADELPKAADNDARVHFTKGVWRFEKNVAISPTTHVVVEAGALIQPGKDVTIKFAGPFDAPNTQIFDFSQGGHVAFPSLAEGQPQARVRAIEALWFGVGNGNGAPDTTAFAELFRSVNGVSSEIEFTPGIYNLGAAQIIPSRCVLRGIGNRNAVQINANIDIANAAAFTIPKGAQDVLIENIAFSTAHNKSPNPFVNQFALAIEPAVDRIAIRHCTFHGFQGGGIFIDGGAFAEGNLHGEITDNLFHQLQNAPARGGNGARPSIGILATNTVSSITLRGNKFDQCDQAALFNQGPKNGMGAIRWLENIVENCGRWGTAATNAVAFEMGGILRMDNPYFEANQVQDVIYLSGGVRPMRTFLLTGGEINGDNSGTIYSVNAITGNNVADVRVLGTIFNNFTGNFARNFNPYRDRVWTFEDTWHDVPRGTRGGASIAEIQAHLEGPIVLRRGDWREFFVQTNEVTIANPTAETSLLGKGIGLARIPANYTAPVRGELTGKLSAKSTRLQIKLGKTVILESDELQNANGAFALHFEISTHAHGQIQIGSTLLNLNPRAPVDTSVAQPIDITLQPSPDLSATVFTARIE